MKPLGKVKIKWSPEFAYAIGLLVTDGNLSPDGRHFDFTSKDKQQILNFMKCLDLKVKIGKKKSGSTGKLCFRIQFGDVNLYKYLLSIGLDSNKSKTIGEIALNKLYFFDFLRGHFDGDGTFYSYFDPRWKNSFMFYTVFISASKNHILWLRNQIKENLKINGHVKKSNKNSVYEIRYAKKESLKLLKRMYYDKDIVCLSRKRFKVERALRVVSERL